MGMRPRRTAELRWAAFQTATQRLCASWDEENGRCGRHARVGGVEIDVKWAAAASSLQAAAQRWRVS